MVCFNNLQKSPNITYDKNSQFAINMLYAVFEILVGEDTPDKLK